MCGCVGVRVYVVGGKTKKKKKKRGNGERKVHLTTTELCDVSDGSHK